MKIKRLQTLNFQGLKGQHSWELNQINALCQPNSAGKSSFLNALKYAIGGNEPEGTLVTLGAQKSAVSLVLEDGTDIIRQKSAGGTNSFFINRKKALKKTVDQTIANESGVPMKSIKVASSEEALKALKPQEFGELILSYTKDELDIPTIKEYVPDLTEDMEALIDERLPSENFGVGEIQNFYKQLYEDRRVLGKAITEKDGGLKTLRSYPKPDWSKSDLEEKEKMLLKDVAEAAGYKEKLIAWQKAKKAIEDRDKTIAERKKQVAEIVAEKKPVEVRNEAEQKLAEARKSLLEANKAIQSFELVKRDTEKVLEGINTSICPLSKKLICTTDKTAVKDELEASVKTAEEGIESQKIVISALEKTISELEGFIRAYDKEQEAWKRKELLIQEIDRLEKMELPSIEEPAKPANENAEAELKKIRNQIQIWGALEKADALEEKLRKAKKKYEAFDSLVKACAPKGPVMERITEKYMVAFEEVCNEKAEKLRPGMRVRFRTENGVRVSMDFKGDDNFLEYDSLSGGEKAVYIYLMLDLLNTLSGLRILIIDELSVLDKEAFEGLVDLIVERKEDYDHVFIACVNHDDMVKVIENKGLTKLAV